MAMLRISGRLEWETVIKAQRSDGEIEPESDTKVIREGVESVPWTDQRGGECHTGIMELIVKGRRNSVVSTWYL